MVDRNSWVLVAVGLGLVLVSAGVGIASVWPQSFGLSVAGSGNSNVTDSGNTNPTQTNEGGSVTILVTHITPDLLRAQGREGDIALYQLNLYHVFEVAMDTHSVELSDYDLAQLAVLKDGSGNAHLPVSWTPSGSGHHVSGVLKFENFQTDKLTLTLRNVAEVEERVFSWSL